VAFEFGQVARGRLKWIWRLNGDVNGYESFVNWGGSLGCGVRYCHIT